MITILVVGALPADLAPLGGRHPSVEILGASDVEDALEKLARNRRIDAVLLLSGDANQAVASAIREEDPGAPPVFAPGSTGPLVGVHTLAEVSPAEAIDALAHLLTVDR